MPLIRIDMLIGHDEEEIKAIASSVYEAVLSAFQVPQNDRHQIITEHTSNHFVVGIPALGLNAVKSSHHSGVYQAPRKSRQTAFL